MLEKSILLFISALIAGAPAWHGTVGLSAQEDPWSRGSAGTGLLLRKLDGVKRVLMIGAHPDDEDTALLAALSRGMGIETAYLSLTRGEGGQNSLGPELDEGLGLVRTGALLAARALDGGRHFFTRAFDFGYSKSAEETFRFWPREEILADVTWVVRTFRPQIIVSAFSGTPRDGHGHHQVAGIVAHEVFVAAGDPTRFPEQIAQGAGPWTPLKLYLLTRRDPQEGTTGVETGTFDPLLGRSYYQVAMDSRSRHRSQDMGVAQPMGPRRSTVALVESRVNAEGADELFAEHGPPAHIRSDNGSEFTAEVVPKWLKQVGVKTLYIEPGSPWENGYNESFNGTLEEELLKREIFYTVKEATVLIEQWRREYNTIRPHSFLGYRPPAPEAIRPDPAFLNLPTLRGPHPEGQGSVGLTQ